MVVSRPKPKPGQLGVSFLDGERTVKVSTHRGVQLASDVIVRARKSKGWIQDDLAERAKVSIKSVIRAEGKRRVDVRTANAITSALGLELASALRPEPTPPVCTRYFDPELDAGHFLLDSLREMHIGGRLRYFHRSLPYQLMPPRLIKPYNESMTPESRAFFDSVGAGRRKDYEELKGHDGMECVMLWSDMLPVVRRQGPYSAFSPADVEAILTQIQCLCRERAMTFVLIDDKRVSAEVTRSESLRRFIATTKSCALLGDRFLLRREASDCLVIDDNVSHREAFLRTRDELVKLAEYDPDSRSHVHGVLSRLHRELEAACDTT
jgi:transcriptional regulator with XRE-family HTH domain